MFTLLQSAGRTEARPGGAPEPTAAIQHLNARCTARPVHVPTLRACCSVRCVLPCIWSPHKERFGAKSRHTRLPVAAGTDELWTAFQGIPAQEQICVLRTVSRQREMLVQYQSKHVQHVQHVQDALPQFERATRYRHL